MFVRLNNVVICILNSNTCLLAFRHKSLLTEAPPFLYFQPHTCFSILTVLTAEEILCFTVVGISVYTGACAVKTFHGGAHMTERNGELINTALQSLKKYCRIPDQYVMWSPYILEFKHFLFFWGSRIRIRKITAVV